MTLILALDCADGMLLASDSQITYSTQGQPVKAMGEKLYLPWENVAWGGSGHGGIIQRVDQALRAQWPNPDNFRDTPIVAIRQQLTALVASTVRQILNSQYVTAPDANPWTTYLFIGHVPEGSFIFEVGTDLIDSEHTDTGYAAIGSADIFPYFAMAGLAHYDVRTRPLLQTRLIAHRILEDAMNVTAFGIGGPVQMIEIAKPGRPEDHCNAKQLTTDEVQAIGDRVTEWKVSEVENLGQFMPIPQPKGKASEP